MSYHLPMIECSSCGKAVGHLYTSYKLIAYYLTDVLAEKRSIDPNAPEYVYDDGWKTLGPYLATYYHWLAEQKAQGLKTDFYEPANVVARGLLRIRDLEPAHLPFGRINADGQRNQFEASICCLRMLHSDPSTQMN